jgi:hypothetical protein
LKGEKNSKNSSEKTAVCCFWILAKKQLFNSNSKTVIRNPKREDEKEENWV